MEENNQNKEPLNKDFKVPKLRFKSYFGSYKNSKIRDIFQLTGGGTPSTKILNFWQGNIPWISSSDLFENNIYLININRHISEDAVKHSSTKLIQPKSILVVTRVGLGKVAVTEQTLCTSQDFTSLFSQNINPYYFAYLIQKRINNGKSQGSTIKGISSHELAKQNISYPSIEEQNRVFSLVNMIDRKIYLLINKIDALKKYKEGLVNLCFCNGKRYKISSFVKQVEKRNKDNQFLTVYSISNKKGFISQTEQFDGNEVGSTNKINYKIVHKNEFAYNPARINVGSIAYFEEEIGQISPMYIVFSIHGISNILLDEYFHSIYFRKELRKHLEGSVRQSLSFENLCDFNINISNFSESFSIIFKALNCKLSLLETALSDLKKIKSYLLENMFI